MNINENWITQLKYYAENFGESNFTYYFPVGAVLSFLLIFTLHQYFSKIKDRTVTESIFRSAYFSILITIGTFLTVVFVLRRFMEFFAEERCELIVLIVLTFLCIFNIIIVIVGNSYFNKKNEHLIILFPISNRIRNEKLFERKKTFKRRKLYWLLVFIPFIFLLIKPNSKYLYSIVIDNSASMDTYLAYGVNSFGSALSYSPKEADYVLSYLPKCDNDSDCINKARKLKPSLEAISKVNMKDSLGSLTYVFNRSEDVVNALNQDIQISGIGSPLSEMIWQNYLNAKLISDNFSEKRLIILTDGGDNLYFPNQKVVNSISKSILDSKTKDGISPRDFYGNIFFINEGGDESLFLLGDSNSDILDGSNSSEYYKSVQTVMSLISFDLIFVYLCFALLLLTFFIILFINPQINN